MAGGFLLGTGSGLLAAAAVYYTISSSITRDTSTLRSEMHHNANVLTDSFDPTAPLASSTYVGPAYPYRPSFGDVVRMKWNTAVGSAFESVRTTDWTAVAAGAYVGGKEVVDKLVKAAEGTGAPSPSAPVVEGVTSTVGKFTSPIMVSGAPTDVTSNDKIEGNAAKVEFIRKVESGTKRLV